MIVHSDIIGVEDFVKIVGSGIIEDFCRKNLIDYVSYKCSVKFPWKSTLGRANYVWTTQKSRYFG